MNKISFFRTLQRVVIVLLLSYFFYFALAAWQIFREEKSLNPKAKNESETKTLTSEKLFAKIQFPKLRNYDWSAPKAQGTENHWQFELFTPPFVLQEGNSLVDYPADAKDLHGISIQPISLKLSPYRLQLEGYMKISSRDHRFFIRDLDTEILYPCSIGMSFPEAGFEICSYEFISDAEEGASVRVPEVTIFDQKDQKEYRLQPRKKLLTNSFELRVLVIQGSRSKEIIFREVGEEIDEGNYSYQLLSLDPNSGNFAIEKRAKGTAFRNVESGIAPLK